MKILLIDNFDSFTYNLVDEFAKRGCQVRVYRNRTELSILKDIINEFSPQLMVLSPGPSHPQKAGISIQLIQEYYWQVPIFGVCLGHQCLVEAFRGRVSSCPEIMHGKPSSIRHKGQGIFKNISNPFQAGRYHSLAVTRLPNEFEVTASSGEIIMGIQHQQYPLFGVQFHPESILTPMGGKIIANLLEVIK